MITHATSTITCAIHQPNFLPRPSTLSKIAAADIWIVLDNVQFNGRDYQHRARLASLTDEQHQQWLSIHVRRPSGRASLIAETVILDQETNARRVSKLIEQYYRRAPHWEMVRDIANEVAKAIRATHRLAYVAEISTRLLLEILGWRGIVIRSSTFATRSGRSTRLADLTRLVGATEYLCGPGGARYLDEHPFAERGLTVRYTPEHISAERRLSAIRSLAMTGAVVTNSATADVLDPGTAGVLGRAGRPTHGTRSDGAAPHIPHAQAAECSVAKTDGMPGDSRDQGFTRT